MMSSIKGRNTSPEMAVRKYLHAAGLRFRLHSDRLPGRPDIVLPSFKVAIFVHGCFWHRHEGCAFATTPASNSEFWQRKFDANVARDAKCIRLLGELGWTPLVFWECWQDDILALDRLFWEIVSTSPAGETRCPEPMID
jgi:DNA mismatch endonuclease (patch repair protein)